MVISLCSSVRPNYSVDKCVFWLQEGHKFMVRFLHRLYSFVFRRHSIILLMAVWFAGLVLSISPAKQCSEVLSLLFADAAAGMLSHLSLVVNMLLPLLLSVLVMLFLPAVWLYLLVFCRALSYGFVFCGIILTFHSAGWLICCLLLFSATLSNAVLVFFWTGYLSHRGRLSVPKLICCAAAIICVTAADYYFIAPLLRLSLV